MRWILNAYTASVDRAFLRLARKGMDSSYRNLRLSPEIFTEMMFTISSATLIVNLIYDFSLALREGKWIDIAINGILVSLVPVMGLIAHIRLARTPTEWTAVRYKTVSGSAVYRRETQLILRLALFFVLLSYALRLFLDFSRGMSIDPFSRISGLIFFFLMNLHQAALAAEPPPPDDGDAFLVVPQAA